MIYVIYMLATNTVPKCAIKWCLPPKGPKYSNQLCLPQNGKDMMYLGFLPLMGKNICNTNTPKGLIYTIYVMHIIYFEMGQNMQFI